MKARLLASGFLFGAVVSFSAGENPAPSQKVKTHLGDKALAILQAPTKVEVFRVGVRDTKKVDDKHVVGYPITATGKEQGKEFGAKLATLLLQDKAWFNPDKFLPAGVHVGYRIWKDKDAVEVVYDGNARLFLRLKGVKGKPSYGNCDPVNAEFFKLAREALPEDADVRQFVPPGS